MKRIALFVLTNLAIVIMLGVVTSVLGVNRFLTAQGLDVGMLLAFSAVIGFAGAFFSLLISKPMAKWTTGARVIEQPSNAMESWLLETVRHHTQKAGLAMPEVAIRRTAFLHVSGRLLFSKPLKNSAFFDSIPWVRIPASPPP